MQVTQKHGKEHYSSKTSSSTPRHKLLLLEWTEKYKKTNMVYIYIYSLTLDGPDGWGKGWVGNCQKRYCRFRRQRVEEV